MKIKVLLLALLVLSGCCTYKKCQQKYPYPIEYVETIVYRDSIVKIEIPGEAKTDSIFIETETPLNVQPFRLNTEFCSSVAWVQNSVLKMDLIQHTVEKEIVFKDVIVEKVIKETVQVEVNKLTRWQEFKGYLGLLFLFMLVIWFFRKLF